LAPSLTFTALNPNNLQRQNVQLALKVFNEKLVAALDEFGKSTIKLQWNAKLYFYHFSTVKDL